MEHLKKLLTLLLAAALLTSAAACSKKEDTSGDEDKEEKSDQKNKEGEDSECPEEIEELLADYLEAIQDGDAEAVIKAMCEDGCHAAAETALDENEEYYESLGYDSPEDLAEDTVQDWLDSLGELEEFEFEIEEAKQLDEDDLADLEDSLTAQELNIEDAYSLELAFTAEDEDTEDVLKDKFSELHAVQADEEWYIVNTDITLEAEGCEKTAFDYLQAVKDKDLDTMLEAFGGDYYLEAMEALYDPSDLAAWGYDTVLDLLTDEFDYMCEVIEGFSFSIGEVEKLDEEEIEEILEQEEALSVETEEMYSVEIDVQLNNDNITFPEKLYVGKVDGQWMIVYTE